MNERPVVRQADPAAKAPNPSVSTEQTQRTTLGLKKRIPMSVPRSKLSVPEIEGYHLHWINDVAGRISQALQGGYEFIQNDEVSLNNFSFGTAVELSGNTDLGSMVSLAVGTNEQGGTLRAYLMKLKNEYWIEDQAISQERVDAVAQQIKRGQVGTNQPGDHSNRYVRQSDIHSNRRA
jgi:hypothetical protein